MVINYLTDIIGKEISNDESQKAQRFARMLALVNVDLLSLYCDVDQFNLISEYLETGNESLRKEANNLASEVFFKSSSINDDMISNAAWSVYAACSGHHHSVASCYHAAKASFFKSAKGSNQEFDQRQEAKFNLL